MFRTVFFIVSNDCSAYSFGREEAILSVDGKDLMPTMLYGTCLMNIYMSGMGTDDSLIRLEDR